MKYSPTLDNILESLTPEEKEESRLCCAISDRVYELLRQCGQSNSQQTGGMRIENEMQYQTVLKRVEELMLTLPEDTPKEDPRMIELSLLGNLVADYDEEHYPMQ